MVNLDKADDKIRELIELNDELENYFRNTIIPQLFVDSDLILRKFTPPAMKQFELDKKHIGRPMEEVVDHIRCTNILENINEVIKSGEILEKEVQTSDSRWFQMNIIPYHIKKDNKLNGVIITFVDITDRINDLKDLEMLNASHETFIYSVSHDLKGPLANIESLSEILVTTASDLVAGKVGENELQGVADMLEKSVLSMRNIINELSEITKIEGNFKETVESVNIEKLLNQLNLTLKDKITESKAVIRLDLKVQKLNYSRKGIRSILYNLLSNAIKYRSTDVPPEIVISTKMADGFILITVKDNGIGIAPKDQDLLFTQFSRLKKNIEGHGIGLYLIKRIVENGGGKITLKSDLGKGCEFTVYLKSEPAV